MFLCGNQYPNDIYVYYFVKEKIGAGAFGGIVQCMILLSFMSFSTADLSLKYKSP